MSTGSDLQVKIIDLLVYFDVLSLPLTAREVYRWVSIKTEYREVLDVLESLSHEGKIGTNRGFYFLTGRQELVETRLSRYAMSLPKLKRAWIFARIISHLPWVRGIALYSSTSFYNTQKTSDLDFFIIGEAGRVWSCRFWVNILLKLLRLRPSEDRKANMFCVSFLVDKKNLDISTTVRGDSDSHYLYGTSQFIFLAGDEKLRHDFFLANSWIAEKLPQWQPYVINSKRRASHSHYYLRSLLEFFGGLIFEGWYRRVQMYILPNYYKDIANVDTRVMLSDHMIKLHHHDGRDWISAQLEQRRSSLIHEANS